MINGSIIQRFFCVFFCRDKHLERRLEAANHLLAKVFTQHHYQFEKHQSRNTMQNISDVMLSLKPVWHIQHLDNKVTVKTSFAGWFTLNHFFCFCPDGNLIKKRKRLGSIDWTDWNNLPAHIKSIRTFDYFKESSFWLWMYKSFFKLLFKSFLCVCFVCTFLYLLKCHNFAGASWKLRQCISLFIHFIETVDLSRLHFPKCLNIKRFFCITVRSERI